MYGGFDVEDHRLRPGERVAQDHQDEHRWHLRLDGPRGHQVIHLLKGQRRLEVSACVCFCVLMNADTKLRILAICAGVPLWH